MPHLHPGLGRGPGARPAARLPVGTAWVRQASADRSRDLPPLKAERGRGPTVLALKVERSQAKGKQDL